LNDENHRAKVKDYFDGDSQRYENVRYTNDFANCHQYSYLARKKHVLSLLQEPGKRILDIGCGPGIYTKELLEQNLNIVALDISPKMIEKAKEKFAKEIEDRKASFTSGEIFDLKNMDKSFDVVICIGVISYIPDIEKFLNKISSLLKFDGYSIIQISKRFSPKSFDEQIIYPSLKKDKTLFKTEKRVNEWNFKLNRYTTGKFNRLCSSSGLELERGIHFDYTLPLINIAAKGLNLTLADFLEKQNNHLCQTTLAGDYVARYRKNPLKR